MMSTAVAFQMHSKSDKTRIFSLNVEARMLPNKIQWTWPGDFYLPKTTRVFAPLSFPMKPNSGDSVS
jgi:hypothetical protein